MAKKKLYRILHLPSGRYMDYLPSFGWDGDEIDAAESTYFFMVSITKNTDYQYLRFTSRYKTRAFLAHCNKQGYYISSQQEYDEAMKLNVLVSDYLRSEFEIVEAAE